MLGALGCQDCEKNVGEDSANLQVAISAHTSSPMCVLCVCVCVCVCVSVCVSSESHVVHVSLKLNTVAKDDPELPIFMPPLPQVPGLQLEPPCLFYVVLGMNPGLCVC